MIRPEDSVFEIDKSVTKETLDTFKKISYRRRKLRIVALD